MLLLFVGGAAVAVLLAGLVLRWSAALAAGVALLGAQLALQLELGSDAFDPSTRRLMHRTQLKGTHPV